MCSRTSKWIQHTDVIFSSAARSCSIHSKAFNNQYRRRAECNIFLYLYIKKKDEKSDENPIYRREVRAGFMDASRFVFIDFSSDIIARPVNAIFIPSQSVHQRHNPKITRFNFNRRCKIR